MAARGRSRLPRVIVETAPDPILEEAVHAEDLQGLTDGGRTPKLGMELMVQDLHQDLCLAPEGHCACAQGVESSSCWRVRMPWWTLSSFLLPVNRFLMQPNRACGSGSGGRERPAPTSSCLQEEMSESTASARSRTPSPDVSYSAVSGHAPPPPRLVFAPAAARPPAAATHPAEAAAALRGPVPPPPTAAEAPGRAGRPASPETAPPESNGTCQAEDVTDSPVSRRSRKGRHCKIQIATHLRRLDDCNPRCVVMVRKINRLGFDASSILQRHFDRYGVVEEVLLSSASERPEGTPASVRVRPSGLGFVLMGCPEAAAAALAAGAEQALGEAVIRVQSFKSKATEAALSQGEEN
mmetsp:Transcript_3084/g.9547  ORF Transcript_3084/g.9547 Transcript_3084/m.9547 type:complete len:353 (-) Transcript_3084:65-1123(-)